MRMTLGVVQLVVKVQVEMLGGPIRPRIKQCLEYSTLQREADHFHLVLRYNPIPRTSARHGTCI